MTAKSDYLYVKKLYEEHADPETAVPMAHYMRDQFRYYGLKSPIRRELVREFLKEKNKQDLDWAFVDLCFQDDYRELQYVACDYLTRKAKKLQASDLGKIKKLVQTKSWWDTVDSLIKLVGKIFLKEENKQAVMKTVRDWAVDPDFWVRRTAIEFQLGLKSATDPELLKEIILENLGSSEFFINKAIGWALRDYSKTNPDWVRKFVDEYREQLAPLSVREASKYI
ncbi:MAG: DNA alkylation repair protein [Lactobacillus equicursoris]|nr:DNA alkylation repair protein [Lactobacillus equicursoris]MDD6407640.1 DNA alkylation repair protein [Lactobacillus equicursoris]